VGETVALLGPNGAGSRRRSTCSSGCAALGILLGHVLTTDSIGPAIGGLTALFALLGGVWFPVTRRSA